MAMPAEVKDVKLSVTQDTLLHSLERKVQLHFQAQNNASLLHSALTAADPDSTISPEEMGAPSLKAFLQRHLQDLPSLSHNDKDTKMDRLTIDPSFLQLANQVDECVTQWGEMYVHAHQSFALVEEMETSHAQVVSKTQALYESFENILQQVEVLNTRVEVIAAPMPHFLAIDGIAHTLGFGVKFAAPTTIATTGAAAQAQSQNIHQQQHQQPVQVFQHRRNIDPTTKEFEQALDKIDASVAYLEKHIEYKDAVCYIEAYRMLTTGGIQILKDYAISGLEAAKDAVQEALIKGTTAGATPTVVLDFDETSPYYVNFQLVAPALTAVAKQLDRFAANPMANVTNIQTLGEVSSAYADQRANLLSTVLAAAFEATSRSTDIVNFLRVCCAQLIRVCEAEFHLFVKLFRREPSDPLFSFHGDEDDSDQDEDANESPFERLIFQLSGLLYNNVRPLMLVQKDLEVLCEIIQVIQSEMIESLIQPRAAVVGFVEPVLRRMIQDGQERLILCMQIYIRDEIEGFTPTPEDLDYPNKLINPTSGSMYATWYPSLEHTLLCLSKVYHFVNMEIFEELAQDAIQICTASLKMAAADLTVLKGSLHGTLFLVKHLLTLREQITPFDIKFSLTNKALDFTSSSDAMNHLLSDVSTIFSFSLQNGLVGLFTNAIPQIQETTSDVKKELEQELKKSCTAFIDAVLQQIAQPLLVLMKQIADLQQKHVKSTQTPIDLRQFEFLSSEHVNKTLTSVSQQLTTGLSDILNTIHLYLRNSSTEAILFKPVQRNLLDAVESLKVLLDQTYTEEERRSCEQAFQHLLQQLSAL